MTTRQISDTVMDIYYGFEVSETFVSDVTDKILPQIHECQSRPPADIYPVLYIDAIHYSIRDKGIIRRKAAYIVMGISQDSMKEAVSTNIGANESAKYWLSVMNDPKNCDVRDILIVCANGLTGIKKTIEAAFSGGEY